MFPHSLHFNMPTCQKIPNALLAQAPLRLIFPERKSWGMLWQKITHGCQSPFHICLCTFWPRICLIPSWPCWPSLTPPSLEPTDSGSSLFTMQKSISFYTLFSLTIFFLVLVAGLSPSTIWWLTVLCLCHHASPRHLTSLSVITQASSPRPTLNCN